MSTPVLAKHIEHWPVDALVPYSRNARTHSAAQIDQLVRSIQTFGFTNPILVDGAKGILAGHGRLKAAVKVGLERVPVIVLDHLTEAERRAYILADNKLAENAGWDEELLASELREIQALDFDLTIPGFDDAELKKLLGETEDPAADECPPVPEQAVTVAGDLWLLGRHRLLCGDATRREDVEHVMAGARADMVFTDPPYGVNFVGAKYNPRAKAWDGIANDEKGGEELQAFLGEVFNSVVVCSVPAAAVYIWSASMQEGYETLKAMRAVGIHVQSQIVWVKNTLVLGQADYQWKHEICWYGWTKGTGHYWNGGRALTTVWEQSKDANAAYVHPMQKPVSLGIFACENSCREDGLVLDLFGGSGSTLIACEKTARNGRIAEIEPRYCDVIVKRWQQYTGKQATRESDGRLFDELEHGALNAA